MPHTLFILVFSESFSRCSSAESCLTTEAYFISIPIEEDMPNVTSFSNQVFKYRMVIEKEELPLHSRVRANTPSDPNAKI